MQGVRRGAGRAIARRRILQKSRDRELDWRVVPAGGSEALEADFGRVQAHRHTDRRQQGDPAAQAQGGDRSPAVHNPGARPGRVDQRAEERNEGPAGQPN